MAAPEYGCQDGKVKDWLDGEGQFSAGTSARQWSIVPSRGDLLVEHRAEDGVEWSVRLSVTHRPLPDTGTGVPLQNRFFVALTHMEARKSGQAWSIGLVIYSSIMESVVKRCTFGVI